MDFNPTHLITLEREGAVPTFVPVQLVDGAAYTREEWGADSNADYECDHVGRWTFQGQPFDGTVVSVEYGRVEYVDVQNFWAGSSDCVRQSLADGDEAAIALARTGDADFAVGVACLGLEGYLQAMRDGMAG